MTVLALSLATAAFNLQGQQTAPEISLAELAEKSDFIALAQARDADYLYRRDFPVSGSAYLKVLIPYKIDMPQDIVDVYEEGLHANECYFPNPTVFEEGRRYLLFLRRDPEDEERYRGLEEGCALEVLVDRDSRYALKYPVTGINLADDLDGLAQEMQFGDAYALEEEENLSPAERDALLAAGYLRKQDDRFLYTHGIELSTIRQLMGPDGLTLDRGLKRIPEEQ
jgi:hypothetical protein